MLNNICLVMNYQYFLRLRKLENITKFKNRIKPLTKITRILTLIIFILLFSGCLSTASFKLQRSEVDIIKAHSEIISELQLKQKINKNQIENVYFFHSPLKIHFISTDNNTQIDLSSQSFEINNTYRQILMQKLNYEIEGEKLPKKSFLTYNLINLISPGCAYTYVQYKNPLFKQTSLAKTLIVNSSLEILCYYLYGTSDLFFPYEKNGFSFTNPNLIALIIVSRVLGLNYNIQLYNYNKIYGLGYSFKF